MVVGHHFLMSQTKREGDAGATCMETGRRRSQSFELQPHLKKERPVVPAWHRIAGEVVLPVSSSAAHTAVASTRDDASKTQPLTKNGADLRPFAGHCAHCGKLACYRCQRCFGAYYCDRACQRTHWSSHHIDCSPPSTPPYLFKLPLSALEEAKKAKSSSQAVSSSRSVLVNGTELAAIAAVGVDTAAGLDEASQQALDADSCVICMLEYQRGEFANDGLVPRRLPCRHVFCTSCLCRVIEYGGVRCPTCFLTSACDAIVTLPVHDPHSQERAMTLAAGSASDSRGDDPGDNQHGAPPPPSSQLVFYGPPNPDSRYADNSATTGTVADKELSTITEEERHPNGNGSSGGGNGHQHSHRLASSLDSSLPTARQAHFELDPGSLSSLTEMGFDESMATAALHASQGDVGTAVAYLFDPASMPSPSPPAQQPAPPPPPPPSRPPSPTSTSSRTRQASASSSPGSVGSHRRRCHAGGDGGGDVDYDADDDDDDNDGNAADVDSGRGAKRQTSLRQQASRGGGDGDARNGRMGGSGLSSSSPSSSEECAELTRQLVEMGFDPERAQKAARKANNDLSDAVTRLTDDAGSTDVEEDDNDDEDGEGGSSSAAGAVSPAALSSASSAPKSGGSGGVGGVLGPCLFRVGDDVEVRDDSEQRWQDGVVVAFKEKRVGNEGSRGGGGGVEGVVPLVRVVGWQEEFEFERVRRKGGGPAGGAGGLLGSMATKNPMAMDSAVGTTGSNTDGSGKYPGTGGFGSF